MLTLTYTHTKEYPRVLHRTESGDLHLGLDWYALPCAITTTTTAQYHFFAHLILVLGYGRHTTSHMHPCRLPEATDRTSLIRKVSSFEAEKERELEATPKGSVRAKTKKLTFSQRIKLAEQGKSIFEQSYSYSEDSSESEFGNSHVSLGSQPMDRGSRSNSL